MSNLLNDERCMKLPASCNFVLRFNWQNIDESIDVSMINFDDHANDELYLHKHQLAHYGGFRINMYIVFSTLYLLNTI